MNFKCFICENLFSELNKIIEHLKVFHKIANNTEKNLKCVVNKSNQCSNTFLTFNGFKKHVKDCVVRNRHQIDCSHGVCF